MKHNHDQFDISQAGGLNTDQADSLFSRIGQSFRKTSQSERTVHQRIDAQEARKLIDCFEEANLGWFWSTDRRGKLFLMHDQ